MSEFVVVSDPRPAVRVVTLNRPEKKNALTRDMYDALAAALKEQPRRRQWCFQWSCGRLPAFLDVVFVACSGAAVKVA